MARSPRIFAALAITCVLVGSLLAATSTTAAAGPGYHRPDIGSCHSITLKQANARSAPLKATKVDCNQRHTYKVLVVKRLRGPVNWNAPDIWRGVFGPCARKAQRVLGNNDKARAMSAYQLFSFIPTRKERARGAKWKVCGLGLFGGRALQPMPKNLDLGRLPLDDSVARCFAGPGANLRVTVCAKKHSFRATGGFRVYGKTYPGQRRLTRLAHQRCPKLTTSRRYVYEIPFHPDQWRVGYRTIVCFTKTSK